MRIEPIMHHLEVDLTAVKKEGSLLRSMIEKIHAERQTLRSAKITCRDHVSHQLLIEVALCPLVELSLDLQPCRFSTRELVEDILVPTRGTLKVLQLHFGALPCIESSLQEHSSLQILKIHAKSSTVQQWERLVTALGTCSQLRAIHLHHAGCLPHNHKLLKQSLIQLVALPQLQGLELINLPTIGLSLFRALMKQHNNSLRKLVVTTYRWGFDHAIQAVARMLATNSTLEELTISAMDQSCLPIFQALKGRNRSLKRLEVCRGSGDLSNDIHEGVIQMLRTNPVLEELLVSRQKWPMDDVVSYLTLNRVRKKMPLQTQQQEWLDAVLEHRRDVRVVYYLLSTNPSFLHCCT